MTTLRISDVKRDSHSWSPSSATDKTNG
ncbi:hypothetical protein CCACVL1_18788 [Corchorus capsularis]|uniref:Uncharacterized protein n=1 Tax=Corchorus capsularis TaxID=210143 RepID=A0A1R3HJU3_COCAP|nr:hypothetical protein CCACVL1_18788 [Corchorus capsularis]